MKKALSFILLLLAMSVNSQTLQLIPAINNPGSSSIVHGLNKSAFYGWDTPENLMDLGTISPFKNLTAPKITTHQVLDSIYVWDLEVPNATWHQQYRYIGIEYDANYNLTGEFLQAWNGSTWSNFNKYIYVYDNRNNLTNAIVQNWNGSTWENANQQLYAFDANNNQTSILYQNYINNVWINSQADTATYDANNNLTSRIYYTWNGSDWGNLYLYEFTYDQYNYLKSYTTKEWNGNSWENTSLHTYTLNSIFKLDNILTQSWTNGTWRNYYKSTFSYDDNNNLTRNLEQSWYALNWVNNIQEIYTYDSQNNQTNALFQGWNGSEWFNAVSYSYTYDNDNFVKSERMAAWDGDGINIRNGDSTYYYYQTVQGINDLAKPDGNISVFPNPNNGKFIINSSIPLSSIEIYNTLGEKIESKFILTLKTSHEVDIQGIDEGIYILKIYDGPKTYSRKIIVQ